MPRKNNLRQRIRLLSRKILPRAHLRRDLRRIDRLYDREINEAKGEKRDSLISQQWAERDLIIADLDEIDTNYWLRQASRYHVPVPHRTARGEDWQDENWQQNHQTGEWSLKDVAISEIQARVHEVQKWRREKWTSWITAIAALIGALTGLVGALIGLAAIRHHQP